MASLQARHSRGCKTYPGRWTPFDNATRSKGCTCTPVYSVVIREGAGIKYERIGKDRQQAERALHKVNVEVDDGTYRALDSTQFEPWADEWIERLENSGRRKPLTVKDYRTTLAYAKAAFGRKKVRDLTPADVGRMDALMVKAELTPSTRAKHIRVLGACLASAVKHGKAARNVVRELPEGERPEGERREAAYFEDAEIPRLRRQIPAGLYRTAFDVALGSGLRQGELLALTWADVDFAPVTNQPSITVSKSYSGGHLTKPKSGQERRVFISPDLLEKIGAWYAESGRPSDDKLMFPGVRGGYLSYSLLTKKVLGPATVAAKVPPIGSNGAKRTWHSLRHTYVRMALQQGASMYLVSKQVGHSSIRVTERVYAHAEDAALAELAGSLTFEVEGGDDA